MKAQLQKNNRGFTLIEVMVTVAILGILASFVVPNYGKMSMKAKLTEGKIQLGGIYAAEKVFYVSYAAYHSSFSAIGFAPEGNVRFNTGFFGVGIGNAGPANGFLTPLTAAQMTASNTLTYCSNAIGGVGLAGNACNTLLGADGNLPPLMAEGFTVNVDSFVAGAVIVVPSDYVFNETLRTVVKFSPLSEILQLLYNQAHAFSPPIPGYSETKLFGLGLFSANKGFQEISCYNPTPDPGAASTWTLNVEQNPDGQLNIVCNYSHL